MPDDSTSISNVIEDFVAKLRIQEEEIRKKNKEIETQRQEIERKMHSGISTVLFEDR